MISSNNEVLNLFHINMHYTATLFILIFYALSFKNLILSFYSFTVKPEKLRTPEIFLESYFVVR